MLGPYEEQCDWSTVSEGCVGDGFVGVGGGSRLSFCSSAGKSHQTGLSQKGHDLSTFSRILLE